MRKPWKTSLLLALALGISSGPVALGACAPAQGEQLTARLRECGLLGVGRIGPYTLSGVYAPDACYEACLAEARCEDLEASLCRASLALLLGCDDRCAFRCDDGGLVGPERVCDGSRQCMGGEDEAGCDFDLVCADGSRVPGARCDGGWNCPDGSDEAGCPSPITICGDGSGSYYPSDRCDGYPRCLDREDERGCPTHVCADGVAITHRAEQSPVCNGYAQCRDGSDETGCAQLTLRCAP